MASGSKNIAPLQYPTGTPIKGAIAMSNRHNWDATNQHVQDLQNQITALQTSLDALRGASTTTGVSSLQTLTGSLTLTSTGASVTITSPTTTTINLEASGGGTVTSFSATVPSGFSANVTNASTTPALAITTTISGILKGTGSGFAVATTSDYPVFVASGASHAPGVVPDPGSTAGTTRFLREDATFAVPPGTATSPGGSNAQIQYNNSGAFGGSDQFQVDTTNRILYVTQGTGGSGISPSLRVTNGSGLVGLFSIGNTNAIFTGTAINDAALSVTSGFTDLWLGNLRGYILHLQDGGNLIAKNNIQPGGTAGGTYLSQDGTSGLGGNAGSTQAGFTTKDGLVTAYSQSAQSNSTVPGGNTIANTTTATAFTSTGTVAANTAAVGNVYRLTLYGVYSTAVLAPTLNLSILLGSTVICTSSSITTIGGLTNDGFRAECLVIVTTAGASGVVEAQGNVLYGTAATTALTVLMANTATIGGIDFTSSNNFSAKITWGTASASNTITLRQFVIEKLS